MSPLPKKPFSHFRLRRPALPHRLHLPQSQYSRSILLSKHRGKLCTFSQVNPVFLQIISTGLQTCATPAGIGSMNFETFAGKYCSFRLRGSAVSHGLYLHQRGHCQPALLPE